MWKISFATLLIAFLAPISLMSQNSSISVSGSIKDMASSEVMPFVTVVLKKALDSSFVTGTISTNDGRFTLTDVKPGDYLIEATFVGYKKNVSPLFVGSLSQFLDIKTIVMEVDVSTLQEVEIIEAKESVSSKMDKKSFDLSDNISQSGGSVLQAMQNLPGVSVQDGKVMIRGNQNVAILVDGKQTAMTGFGSQSGLDNIPASSIEKIEIITNPSSKYDANGNAGIINIIYKKDSKEGLNGKAGMAFGAGSLWERRENLPTMSAQYTTTPKYNPNLSINYRKGKVNAFFQGDYLYTETLNKNEFVTRVYDDGLVINQQTMRNRDTHFGTFKGGIDWYLSDKNTVTLSGLYGTERIKDHGEEPFFNSDLSERMRMWQFLEDEVKTTIMASANFEHKYEVPGRLLKIGYNYTFHREDEKYFFKNIYPTYTGFDSFALISDEQVNDVNLDYTEPLKSGRFETGLKVRYRNIPTNMQFYPGLNSPLDSNAGGRAEYKEIIPAVYGTYIYESKRYEAEIGVRLEYIDLNYYVNPDHPTYKSDGYSYTQPFPNARIAYKLNDHHKLSAFYNRRVDRPNEVDIRIFPKYDDAEIIKVGNPALKPQFTSSYEMGYKTSWKKGNLYTALYYKMVEGTITRISTSVAGDPLIYAVFQNIGKSYNSGIEMTISHELATWYTLNLNALGYYNKIDAYSLENLYPEPQTISLEAQDIYSGNVKLNNLFHLPSQIEAQVTVIYLAPDLIPQGRIDQRFSVDLGVKKSIQKEKGEVFLNATDIFNTLVINQHIQGNNFYYTSKNYAETQVFRVGYTYKF